MSPRELLDRWLARQLPAEATAWLEKSAAQLQSSGTDSDLYMAVSLVTRKVGKADLRLNDADLREANAARRGLGPARLERRPGRARASGAGAGERCRAAGPLPRSALHHRRRERAGGVLSRPAAVSGAAALPGARHRGAAHQHEERVRVDRAPQPLSERAVSGSGVEPDGAQGAVRGQRAVADRRARPRGPTRRWRACCATMRTSAGRRAGR